MEKDDELGKGYSLDDFGLNFDENAVDLGAVAEIDAIEQKRKLHSQSYENIDESNPNYANYAPQFQGFDFSDETITSPQTPPTPIDVPLDLSAMSEKEALFKTRKIDKQSEIGALFVAYTILFLILLLFMPQIYLANNIYYTSKNIHYLKSQREALRDENGDLQQKLESLKFNFLTLEIEEIK